MTEHEKFLVRIMAMTKDQNAKALLLQSFISEFGPLSEIAASKVREILGRQP